MTLEADYNVSFKAPVTVAGTAGLTIVTNENGTGGDLIFTDTGSVKFWDTHSSLIINDTSYTLVKTLPDLADAIEAQPGGAFALAQNYDTGQTHYNDSPIATSFEGQFEGLGNTIDNLDISTLGGKDNCVGLFASAEGGSLIRDMMLTNVHIDLHNNRWHGAGLGGLVGCTAGTIINVSVNGSLQQVSKYRPDIGLIAGKAETVMRSQAIGAIASRLAIVGGLVGSATNIESSHAIVNILADHDLGVGGLAGIANSVTESYAVTDVSTHGTRSGRHPLTVGGLAATSEHVSECFATGTIAVGRAYSVGGLVGVGSDIENSYAMTTVTANGWYVGGLIGSGESIANSYSTSSVGQIKDQQKEAGHLQKDEGGFIGYDFESGSLSVNYWDLDTSGISDPAQGAGNIANDPGVTGLTDDQLKSGLPAGFDPAIWGQKKSINNGYPYLLANPPPH